MPRAAIVPIVPLADTVESINMIIYGDPGVGKTVQAGTLPNALFLSTDASGTVSAKRQNSSASLWPISNWQDLANAYKYLKEQADAGEAPFEWIIIDTGTKMQEMCLRDILERETKENPDRNPDIPAIQNHQEWQNRFKRFIDMFIALPYNVCFVFHVMTKEDEEGEEIRIPQLSGGPTWVAIARSMPARVSVMGFMQEKFVKSPATEEGGKPETKLVRRINWRNGPNFMAKDRYDCLPKFTDDVPLDRVVRRIIEVGTTPINAADVPAKAAAGAAGAAGPAGQTKRAATRKAAPRKAASPVSAVTAVDDDEEED